MNTAEIPLNRLYHDLAHLWPLLSPPEDYAEEAAHWRKLLRRALGPGRHPILDLGVGGGHHLSHLAPEFQAEAVDLSETMIQRSHHLNPDVKHHCGDMRNIRLKRKFRAVLIHDAISHMTTETDLGATFRTAAAHLEPGGIMIAAPDWLRETFDPPWTAEISHVGESARLTTFEYVHDPDPLDTTIETLMTHIIEQNGTVTIEHDRLLLGLFPRRVWQGEIEGAGLKFAQHESYLATAGVSYVLMTGRMPAKHR